MSIAKNFSRIVSSSLFQCGALLAVMAVSGCHSAPKGIGDPYFANVKSTANVYARQAQSGVLKIAVMPFKASTELIGSSVSDMVVTELLRTQKYSLVERGQMSKVLSETELAMAGLSETKAVEAAKMLGAEAVVIGTVDEYGMQAKGGDTYAVVGLSIRLINCASGKIIWSADLAKIADDDDTPLATHARNVVHELVSGLYQNLTGQSGTLPPPAPLGVNVSEMGLREAEVQWTQPDYPAKYRIERSVAQDGPFVSVGEANATDGRFVDSGPALKDSTVYYYRIVGVGKTGTASDPSKVVETMTAPPPDPPGNVTVRAPSSRCVAVAWTPPRSDGLVKYRIERAVAGSTDWKQVGTAATTTFKDGGVKGCDLADSTTYRYRVIAENRVGAVGTPSRAAEVKTLPPPAVVSGFSAVANQVRCVPISWTANPEKDIVGYELERSDSENGSFVRIEEFKAGISTYLDGKRDPGNLDDSHLYRYRIRAFNDVGAYGAWTPPLSARTRPVPPAPQGVTVENGLPRSVRVKWTMSPDEKVVGYIVERTEADDVSWKEVKEVSGRETTTLYDRNGASEDAITGKLKDGTAYLYRVTAVNTAEAKSEASEPAKAVTKPAPKVPQGVSTTKDVVGKIKIMWTKNPEPDIVEYRVEVRSMGFMWKELASVKSGCEALEDNLSNGEKRQYRVKAIDANTHESEWSEIVEGMARPIPPPPTGLRAVRADDSFKLSFTPPREGMTAFKIYRKKFLGAEFVESVQTPEAAVAAPPAGESADYVVTAVDEQGLESEPSEKVTVQGQ